MTLMVSYLTSRCCRWKSKMYDLAARMRLFFFSKSMDSSGAPHISDALVLTSMNNRRVESWSMQTRSIS